MSAIPNFPANQIAPGRALPADLVDDLQRVQKAAQKNHFHSRSRPTHRQRGE